jgi:hypothetical protein
MAVIGSQDLKVKISTRTEIEISKRKNPFNHGLSDDVDFFSFDFFLKRYRKLLKDMIPIALLV